MAGTIGHAAAGLSPRRAKPADHGPVLSLIRESFAYMDGRIDPPSSMHRLTEADIAAQAEAGEVWLIDGSQGLLACMFLTFLSDAVYIGKLAVAEAARGQGLSRLLIDHAEARAVTLGLPAIELQTRVELTENQAIFARMGFARVGSTRHEGYDRPTSHTYRKFAAPRD